MNAAKIVLGLVVVLAALISGCIEPFSDCIAGSGNVVSKDFVFEEFSGIYLAVPANVYLTQGVGQSLKIDAQDNILEILNVGVDGGRLTISSERCYTGTKPVNIYVSMRDVEDLSISGSGRIISQTEIDSDKLKLGISGSGSLDLSLNAGELNTVISGSGKADLGGAAKTHNLVIEGSGDVKAFNLSTGKTDIKISGSGNVEVDANEELNVNILGSGNVFYTGDAKVSQSISGSGKIVER